MMDYSVNLPMKLSVSLFSIQQALEMCIMYERIKPCQIFKLFLTNSYRITKHFIENSGWPTVRPESFASLILRFNIWLSLLSFFLSLTFSPSTWYIQKNRMNDTIIQIPAFIGVVAEKMPNHRLSFHFNDHFSVDVYVLTIFRCTFHCALLYLISFVSFRFFINSKRWYALASV